MDTKSGPGNSLSGLNKLKGKKILFWSPDCRYDVILNVVKKIGWKLVDDEKSESRVNMYWIDIATIQERFRTIHPWQMINHFPGMPNIARKNRMGQNLNKMQKIFPREYSFYPRTWVLPAEMGEFRQNFDAQGNSLGGRIFIIKPDAGCQGRGIFLTRTFDTVPQQENVVAQMYIKKPLLLDGFKFDLRIYVLVTCIKPLRMYLFHDGLVRMCTEEYVKPTKQNISMTCMHLTNYAVNKHNTNFVQPSAKSTDEKQDEGSKRSVHWFMNWIREQQGDAKADWLWGRVGTLCVRTLLSILPTLSREYDQHFKSFNNVPFTSVPQAGNVSSSSAGSSSKGVSSGTKPSAMKPLPSKRTAGGKNESETEDEDEDEDDDDEDGEEEEDDREDGAAVSEPPAAPSSRPGSKEKRKDPTTRGCRCFEVLGYDIMIDANLKPWLIEVNHLPSFGTDSPLDRDIKDRLMQQVFQVLPARSDDEQAYIAHHKAEAGKRLTGRNQRTRPEEEDPAESRKRDSSIGRPPAERTTPKPQRKQSEEIPANTAVAAQAATVEPEGLGVNLPSVDGAGDTAGSNGYNEDYPVTPERMQEIVDILTEIYTEYSPEKVNKIGRLLQKYVEREEEFLRFVYHKYGITPRPTPKQLAAAQAAAAAAQAAAETEAAKKRASSGMAPKPPNGSRDPRKPSSGRTFSRSLSPPPSNRRAPAVWRCAGVEEDLPFRSEVLGVHWPAEDDIWMEKEQRLLTQFTRIFPRLPKGQSEIDADNDENEGDDGDEDGVSVPATNSVAASSAGQSAEANCVPKFRPASYEDIIVQAFVLDKRQTMRLHHPLAARMRTGNQEELPPLDTRSAVLPGGIGSNSGKGVVGWRAPAQKPSEKKEIRVPTQAQLDAAKRLSLGLSVARDGVTIIPSRSSKYSGVSPSIVLDPDVPGQMLPTSITSGASSVQSGAQQYQYPPYPAGLGSSVSEKDANVRDLRERESGSQAGLVIWSGVPGDATNRTGYSTAQPSSATLNSSFQQHHHSQYQSSQYDSRQYSSSQSTQPPSFHSSQTPVMPHVNAHPSMGSFSQQPSSTFQQSGFAALGSGLTVSNMSIANQRARLVEEGKQTRMRLEAGRMTPAAVLRQQIYKFVPNDPNNPTASLSLGLGIGPGMPAQPAGLDGASLIGVNPHLQSVHGHPAPNGTVHSSKPSLDGLPHATRDPLPSFAQHVHHQKIAKQQSTSQDVLLKELFPGWF